MSEELLLKIKPKFVTPIRFFSKNFWLSLATSSILVIYSFAFAASLNDTDFSNLPIAGLVLAGIAIFIISLTLLMLIDLKNFEATTYRVYSDKIEFEEGFINHKHTIMKIADIKEIHFEQNFFQRMFEVGTIKFITAANSAQQAAYSSLREQTGIAFVDIENPNSVYRRIKQIHEN